MHKERANGEWVSDRRLACSSSVSRPTRMHFCGRFLVSRYRWQQHSAENIRPSTFGQAAIQPRCSTTILHSSRRSGNAQDQDKSWDQGVSVQSLNTAWLQCVCASQSGMYAACRWIYARMCDGTQHCWSIKCFLIKILDTCSRGIPHYHWQMLTHLFQKVR